MKVIFNNTLKLNKTAINVPFKIEQTPIGVILDVNEDCFTVEIWDKYCGYEFYKQPNIIDGVYLSSKEQYTRNELDEIIKG